MPSKSEMIRIDPQEEPFVLVVGGLVGPGELGSDETEDRVEILVVEIQYLPWNQEHTTPRRMKLVYPSELAIEFADQLKAAAAAVPTASDQALAMLTEENK